MNVSQLTGTTGLLLYLKDRNVNQYLVSVTVLCLKYIPIPGLIEYKINIRKEEWKDGHGCDRTDGYKVEKRENITPQLTIA